MSNLTAVSQTKHRETIYENLVSVEPFSNGKYAVTFYSTFSGAKNPTETNKKFSLILDKKGLQLLRDSLDV